MKPTIILSIQAPNVREARAEISYWDSKIVDYSSKLITSDRKKSWTTTMTSIYHDPVEFTGSDIETAQVYFPSVSRMSCPPFASSFFLIIGGLEFRDSTIEAQTTLESSPLNVNASGALYLSREAYGLEGKLAYSLFQSPPEVTGLRVKLKQYEEGSSAERRLSLSLKVRIIGHETLLSEPIRTVSFCCVKCSTQQSTSALIGTCKLLRDAC